MGLVGGNAWKVAMVKWTDRVSGTWGGVLGLCFGDGEWWEGGGIALAQSRVFQRV